MDEFWNIQTVGGFVNIFSEYTIGKSPEIPLTHVVGGKKIKLYCSHINSDSPKLQLMVYTRIQALIRRILQL